MAADLLGLLILLILSSILTPFVIQGQTGYIGVLFFFVLNVVIGHCCWRDSDSPNNPAEWIKFISVIPVWGAVLFAIDIVIGQLLNPKLGLIAGAMENSQLGELTIGVVLTMGVIGIAGLVRSLFLIWHENT